MTPEQCRAARALAGLSQKQLAHESRLSSNTVVYFEAGKRTPQRGTLDEIRSALATHGVIVTRDGVRWASPEWVPSAAQ